MKKEINTYKDATESFIPQSRSNYQILNFVINQHDTPEMRYKQIIIEGRSLFLSIEISKIEIEKNKIEIKRLSRSKDEIDLLNLKIKELEMENTKNLISSMEKELDFLSKLFEKSKKFTEKEIEDSQEEYWKLRLFRQSKIDQLSAIVGVGPGNLDSMLISKIISDQDVENILSNVGSLGFNKINKKTEQSFLLERDDETQ